MSYPHYSNECLGRLAKEINRISAEHGFWPEEGRNFGEMIALAHSELSEALESHRDGEPAMWHQHDKACPLYLIHNDAPNPVGPCNCQPKPEGAAVDLVDCIIRCLDTLYSLNVDIDEVMAKKMIYNDSRPHMHERAY